MLSEWRAEQRETERGRKAKRQAAEKARIAALVTRWVRRSHGTLGRLEARALVARLQGSGGTDFIGIREPGHFAQDAAASIAYNRRKGLPVRDGHFASFCRDKFFHYGPSGGAGLWPGDSLVWDAEKNICGRKGAWVVKRGNG